MTSPGTLRIGIWADDARLSSYDRDLVEWARSRSNVELAALVVSPSRASSKRPGIIARALFHVLNTIERALLCRRGDKYREHGRRFDAGASLAAASIPIVSVMGADFEQFRTLALDLIVFVGAELPLGGFPNCAVLGAIAFESAVPLHRRGLPDAFWEVFDRQDTPGFAVRGFAGTDTAGEVLLRGHVPTRHFYLMNQAALHEKAYHYLRSVIDDIASSRHLPIPRPSTPNSQKPAAFPTVRQSLAYLRRFFSAMIGKKLSWLAGRREAWQVAFLRSHWRKATLWQGLPIDNPRGRDLADPFVIRRGGTDCCFVEDFDCVQEKGCISVYELGSTKARRLGVAIDEPFHLSFPYLFEYQDSLFMCPESAANNDIRIYRCVEFPMKWALEQVVMSGVSAADTMIFQKSGRWWLFTVMDPGGTGELASELFVFFADSPLATTWTPHAMNPVVFDAGYARNAGLLVEGDRVFRVSQRQGFARYGKNSQINEIVELTDHTYEERCVEKIEPRFREGLLGTHHLHGNDEITVFDFLIDASAGGSRFRVASMLGDTMLRFGRWLKLISGLGGTKPPMDPKPKRPKSEE